MGLGKTVQSVSMLGFLQVRIWVYSSWYDTEQAQEQRMENNK